jgi:hypothetical protein
LFAKKPPVFICEEQFVLEHFSAVISLVCADASGTGGLQAG